MPIQEVLNSQIKPFLIIKHKTGSLYESEKKKGNKPIIIKSFKPANRKPPVSRNARSSGLAIKTVDIPAKPTGMFDMLSYITPSGSTVRDDEINEEIDDGT